MPAKVTVRLKGVGELKKALEAGGDRAFRLAAEALYQEGEQIMTKSKEQCPVDVGNLRSTGHVELPEIKGKRVTVELGYGGPSGMTGPNAKYVGYALYVHEDLTARHKVGKAKFLEDPMVEAANGLADRVASYIKPRLGL